MNLEKIEIRELHLDKRNPRLPEEYREAPESSILDYLRNEEALDELAQSFIDNGYFENDPLIVVRQEDGAHNIVVEGNRRLATLKILLGDATAGENSFPTIQPTKEQKDRLLSVPCFVVDTRAEVSRFIGFRHIGGLRLWPPEAKARYVLAAVDELATLGEIDPFRAVGKQVGSNAQGIRSLYTAIYILKYAREEFGINVKDLQTDRFGVWLRALNSQDLKVYIDLPQSRTYQEVRDAVTKISQDKFAEVVEDLTPKSGKKAAIFDSRMITDYGRILVNARAHELFKRSGDFETARQIVDSVSLLDRISRLAEMCSAIVSETSQQEEVDLSAPVLAAATKLALVAKSLNDLLRARGLEAG